MQQESVMIFVNNRARADFVGYVDGVTLAPVKSPATRGIRVFNTLVNVPVPQFRRTLQEELSKQLERLSSATPRDPWTTRQLLLTEILPKLGYEKDLCAIAAALPASLPAVRQDAAARLEGLLLLSDYRDKSNIKTVLLSVAQMTKSALLQPNNDEHDMRVYVNLHMMCTSALLTKSDSPASGSECKTFMLTQREVKQQTGSRQEMLKAVLSFYDHFEARKKRLSLSGLQGMKRPQEFARKHFCEQISDIFQLLNEASQEGWGKRGWELLEELRELYQTLPTAGKYQLSPENNAVLDFMILRGLVILLNTTFATVRFEAGSDLSDHAKLAAEITVAVASKCLARPSGSVEVSAGDLGSLLFHESCSVKKTISSADILSLSSLLLFYNKYLNDKLRIADLHISDLYTTQENDEGQEGEVTGKTCGWHRFIGRMREGSVEGSVLVHTKDCLVEDSRKCLKKISLGGQIRHLEMLLQLSPSPHIVQLLAYQVNPFPFYVTEQVKGQRLLDHLLSHRTGQRWLDTSTLCRVSLDIVSALEFLDSNNIASLDITAYDMVVAGRRRRGGKAGELIEVLASDEFTIRLANLALAHQYRSPQNSERIITVAEQGPVPVLWTAPEGLVKGEYSCKSMVYSLGCVMYELWTHGFEPFSSNQKTTVETLTQMLTAEDSVTLVHWSCIPDNVYEVIRKCTDFNPSRRPQLKEIRNMLTEFIAEGKAKRRLSVTIEHEYPRFNSDQLRRRHVPERGIPKDLQPVLDRLKGKGFDRLSTARASDGYIDDDRVIRVKESELMSRESCKIIHKENCTSVRENLSPMFVKDVLMSLLECSPPKGLPLPGVTDCTHAASFGKDSTPDGYLLDERVYPPSWTLKEAAAKGLLIEDGHYVHMGPQDVFDVFTNIAKTMHVLHERHWLLRDLRASYILLTRDEHKVCFCRIGRMIHLPSSEMSFVQEPFEDSRRWLAPEVLTSGKYTPANDVFMLGTVFWETFRAREIARKNPSTSNLHSVPFASCEQEMASSLVKTGTPLPKPAFCPDWLYDVILRCRLCEPSERPSALQVLQTLEKFLLQGKRNGVYYQ